MSIDSALQELSIVSEVWHLHTDALKLSMNNKKDWKEIEIENEKHDYQMCASHYHANVGDLRS